MTTLQVVGGILFSEIDETMRSRFFERARHLGIEHFLHVENGMASARFRLQPALQLERLADFDTLALEEKLHLPSLAEADSLEREILLAMLLSPVTFNYPSYAEFTSTVRIRCNIVEAARRTSLAFHTSKIERPIEYWTYAEEAGFTTVPGKPLIEALRQATQPEVSGAEYAFSCYRATEYVILLGIAQELALSNPTLLHELQKHWEHRAIMSRQFHDVFLYEYGSMEDPLPHKYYVPGDRVWFRNPDSYSSDMSGYEGSWVLYLGKGLFTNFWQRDRPYTLVSKCVEIYHWRHGIYRDAEGHLQMDETVVEARTMATLKNPDETAHVLSLMMRMRDAQGIYQQGGCIDASREYPRMVCPGTSDIALPGKAQPGPAAVASMGNNP